jgi:hypothetical protein
MDPFVATIVKQGFVLALGVGTLAFVIFFVVIMAKLEHASTLTLIPPSLP